MKSDADSYLSVDRHRGNKFHKDFLYVSPGTL